MDLSKAEDSRVRYLLSLVAECETIHRYNAQRLLIEYSLIDAINFLRIIYYQYWHNRKFGNKIYGKELAYNITEVVYLTFNVKDYLDIISRVLKATLKATIQINYNQADSVWVIHLTYMDMMFRNHDIKTALRSYLEYILENRKDTDSAKSPYTL